MRVEVGDSIRVGMTNVLPVEGALVGWREGGLLMRVDGLDEAWPLRFQDLSSLQVYTLRTAREGFRHGAVLGAVSGIFVGAALGLLLHTTGVIGDEESPPAQILSHGLAGAGIGFGVGAMVGGFWYGRRPSSGWIQITLPRF